MANTIKQKRGTTDPAAGDLVVGELAINTTDGGVFTKTDGGTVVEVGSGGGGASEIDDLSDAVTNSSGVTIGLGTGALSNDDGSTNNNTAIGYNAGLDITSGANNVCLGYTAGRDITTAGGNIAIGNVLNNSAGVTGGKNVAIGDNCGEKLTTGNNNVFIGTNAGEKITTGLSNVFIGDNCGSGPTTVTENTFVGRQAGSGNTGSRGVCLGGQAGTSVSGDYNTIIGYQAAYNVSLSGTNNIILGYGADASTTSVSNEITLGDANITSLRIPGLQSGAADEDVLTYDSTNGNITLKPKSVLSTSAITDGDHNADFTGISTDWVSIEVTFENLSTTSTNNVVLQVGTSSGFVESGYDSHSGRIGTTGVSGGVNTVGFSALIGGDAHTLTGTFILTKIATGGTNVMVMASLTGSRNDNDTSFHGHGFVEISTSTGIDRVRITPSSTNNFDKDGTVNVRVFY